MDPLTPLPLDPALAGARIQGVQQPDAATVLLETHRPGSGAGGGAARWLLDVGPDTARLMRTFQRPRRGQATRGGAPPVFCQWLRARLVGGRVEALALRHPQLVQLTISRGAASHGTETLHLLLELNRRESNLLLLDGAERLLIALRHPSLPGRRLGPEQPYVPPPTLHAWPRGLPLAERYPAPDEAAARALEQVWLRREGELALEARRGPALQAVRRELKRLRGRFAKLEEDQAGVDEAEQWRRRGELLQIHIGRLRPGMASIEVPDVFEPGQPLVTIPLEPNAEPGENIARCFRQFRKRRDATPHVAQRQAETRAALVAWEALRARLEAADTPAALEALAAQLPPGLPGAGALRPLLRGDATAPARQAPAPAGPLRRVSAEGYEILVGRSREENDRLTFRLGRGRDWWLHAQGIGGSHVLVRNPRDGALPPRTLREAAWLAAYYSQARASGRVEVVYAQRKHVRRQPGGEPGQVLYTQDKSLLVALDDPELRQVLQRTAEDAG